MIRIEDISLEFTVPDEGFAHTLYAGWDIFCRECIEKVLDECLSLYDRKTVLREIERLDIDLGTIPEEDFYREFPLRLKETLSRNLPAWGKPTEEYGHDTGQSASSRRDNLLHYLEHGFQQPEWMWTGFDLDKELKWLKRQPPRSFHETVQRTAALCLKHGYALRRLLWQASDEGLLLKVYASALSYSSFGQLEKQRFLALLLEEKPSVALRFVRHTENRTTLRHMSLLLDTLSVRKLMQAETKEHAEVNLSAYWHYLYEWLIRYYPFNGIAVFGGKTDFIRHLHFRLLTFIRKRNGSPYLSKAVLTVEFLREVFGNTYYKDVLNAIYRLQPRNADGSPVYDNYYNRELYRIFLQLSLLQQPADAAGGGKINGSGIKDDLPLPADVESLAALLDNGRLHDADKRRLLSIWAERHPQTLVRWIQSAAMKEHGLFRHLAELADDAAWGKLLASLPFKKQETLAVLRKYLTDHKAEISWLKDFPASGMNRIFRLSGLHLLATGDVEAEEDIKTLLQSIYREITGNHDKTVIKPLALAIKCSRLEAGKDAQWGKETADIRHLRLILSDASLPELEKRRTTARFWDKFRESPAGMIRLLSKLGILADVLALTDTHVLEALIRQTMTRIYGFGRASTLWPLVGWLVTNEAFVSPYLLDTHMKLRVQMLYWFASHTQNAIKGSVSKMARSLLVSLFKEYGIPLIVREVAKEALSDGQDRSLAEPVLALLGEGGSPRPAFLPPGYKEWLARWNGTSDAIQDLFETHWNTAERFWAWLEDTSADISDKRGWLRKAAAEKPDVWWKRLAALPHTDKTSVLLRPVLPVQDILEGMAKVNFHQAGILSRTVEWLRSHPESIPFGTTGETVSEYSLQVALLSYLQEADALNRSLPENEIIGKFMRFLHLAVTGKKDYGKDEIKWRHSISRIASENRPDNPALRERHIGEILSTPFLTHAALQGTLSRLMEEKPDMLLTWLEREAGATDIGKLAGVSDRMLVAHWAEHLSTTAGFAHPEAFRKLWSWLQRQFKPEILAFYLFTWLKEPGWATYSPEEMEAYFFIRLFGKSDTMLPISALADKHLPESIRKRLFRQYLYSQPERLLNFIRASVSRNVMPLRKWLEWTSIPDWLSMAASLSLAQAELLRQIIGHTPFPEKEQEKALALCLINNPPEEWRYHTPQETVRDFVQALPFMQGKAAEEREELIRKIETGLGLDKEIPEPETDVWLVENAGLCLLAPWFVRLFAMLGYLDEERKKFRNTASKVRAVFLMQYLAYGKEKAWREAVLTFNRLLTALSGHVPLPKRLTLTDGEKQTADGMVAGVKANWPQMNGTSVVGFRGSFLIRGGRLEQEEKRWLLTVEDKAYDILLETVPWGFRQIRLPWLKKYVQVKWHEKQTF